ncbi:MAG: DUF3150 domain-containing protein [Candidatus Competibacteraceae bacterium]|jgi:hypothetical protein|nr:DUF3150 domain-containing protein [Candidatus Competibacteraceae bacterium]
MSTATVRFDQVADQVTFINLDILCWTGSKTLQPEDLGLNRDALPPEKLVHLGSKQLIDPKDLAVFTTTRAAARRACLAVGIRFLGGFIVPNPKVAGLLNDLEMLEQKFTDEKRGFLNRFETMVDHWVKENPAWESLIRGSQLSAGKISGRLAFAVQAVKLAAPAALTHGGLDRATQGLSGTLFQEVATLAKDSLKNSFLGRNSVTQRALRPLRAIQQKLDGLGFLDQRVRPVYRDIDRTLAVLPHKGEITGQDLRAVIGLLSILEDPMRLQAHGDRLINRAELTPEPEAEPSDLAQGELIEAEAKATPPPVETPVVPLPSAKVPSGWF